MTRRLLSVTTAIMLVFATGGKPFGGPAFISGAAAQSVDPALAASLENANAAVAAAEAALADAQAKGEGIDAAQQALEAAKAQQAAVKEQIEALQAAQPAAVPQEIPKEETVEAPAEKPVEAEQPQEQTQAPEAESVEKPAAAAPDPAPEKPVAETNRDDVAPEGKPKKPVAEMPEEADSAKETSEPDPAAQPADMKPQETAEQPVEKPVEARPQETAEQPVEKPVAEDEVAAPEGQPDANDPVADVEQKPEEKPETGENTVANPADKSDGEPVAKPVEKDSDVAAEKPVTAPEKPKEAEAATPPEKKPAEAVQKKETSKENVAAGQKPSEDAPKAKDLADAPIEKQIEAAEKKPAAVVPDEVTKAQQESLKAAEQVRRAEAKQKRAELIAAAAAGVAVGALLPVLGGKVVEDEGDRFVVERDGEYYVRRDESALFRDDGADVFVEPLEGGRTRETITRPNGVKIVTLRDPGGYVLRRLKVLPNGDEITLFDTRDEGAERFMDYDSTLPPLQVDIPQDQYIVSGGSHDRRYLSDVFLAPPVEPVETQYSLRNIRENNRIRSKVRRVDLDSITFDTGSATVRQSQVPFLADIAGSLLDVVGRNPQAVFLIEGHTDAVGSEIYNLTLSDRRAETVARILVDAYGVPPENLVVEGYGEQFLKIDTAAAERRNRRVTIRNISPLLSTAAR